VAGDDTRALAGVATIYRTKGFHNMKSILLATVCLGLMAGTALAAGDPAKGEKVAKVCQACHSLTDKTNKTGPYLVGIVGRPVASAEGYSYDDAMKTFAATGAKWDEATLDKYLTNPKELVPGNKMAFAGVKKEDQRADLIAYLATLK
jgi:cytochrome c